MSPAPRRILLPIVVALIVGVLALTAGIWLGGHPEHLPGGVRKALVGDGDAALLREGLDVIKDDYYRKLNGNQLANSGLAAIVRSLHDRFSRYIDPHSFAGFQRDTAGKFGGIGVTVKGDPAGLKIVKVTPGSPAAQAGIRVGDLITAVGDKPLRRKPTSYSTELIKGEPGTSVTLTVRSGKKTARKTLTRANIDVPIVASKMLHSGKLKLGYVAMRQFTSGVHTRLGKAVRGLLAKGAKGIVLDLRGNPGGLVSESQLTASLFLAQGQVVVSTDGRTRSRAVLHALGGAINPAIPMVVLVNQDSASAAEILTAALQDHRRATIVGTRTYGKGVFQEVRQLSNGGALDITVGEYFTPNGRNLGGGGVKEGKGVTPDVKAPDDPHTKADETLRAGLRALARKLK